MPKTMPNSLKSWVAFVKQPPSLICLDSFDASDFAARFVKLTDQRGLYLSKSAHSAFAQAPGGEKNVCDVKRW